ncbi:MAG: hypothetical protein F4056_09140 [Chloroflexi bacterium]|nr:hypothetical protein [Chloroflexota bacterium]
MLFAAVLAGIGGGAAIEVNAGKVASQAITSRVAAVAAAVVATAFIYAFLRPVPVVVAMLVAALVVAVALGSGGTEGAWGLSFLAWLPAGVLGGVVALISAVVYAIKPPPRRRTL